MTRAETSTASGDSPGAAETAEDSRPNPLAGYEDWPTAVRQAAPFQAASQGAGALARILGLRRRAPTPRVLERDRRTVDDVEVRRLQWSVGYGPDTTAWLLRPAGVPGDLPGVLGMHCHGGVRSVGGEQLVGLGDSSSARAAALRAGWYSGRAPANELARRGFVVLVHDTFSWGSRRFDLSNPTPRLARTLAAYAALRRAEGAALGTDEQFDLASNLHEDTLAKAAGTLGQTLAGAVLTDDLAALDVLAATDGVDADRLSTFGFSGGGARSLLLAALDPRVRAFVVSCMMATFESLVPSRLDEHSWLLNVPGLWSFSDWPDLTGLTPARCLVQYRLSDPLFPLAGMRAADERLQALHAASGGYRGTFTAGGHEFDTAMQDEAFDFLVTETGPRPDRGQRP